MRQLFDSDMELLVASDFVYLPLLMDPEIEKETLALLQTEKPLENPAHSESKTVIKHNGKYFVKGLRISSLLDNYPVINDYVYRQLKIDCLEKYHLTRELDDMFLDGPLRTLLFQVMPYFIKKNRGLQRNKFSDEDILNLIRQQIDIPEKYHREAEVFLDVTPLKQILKDVEDQKPTFTPLEDGLYPGQNFRDWFHDAIAAKILAEEHHRIAKALQLRIRFRRTNPEHIATLLYIADTGTMEIDGFGFARNKGYREEYLVYKRTGDYILKDYYGRSYLFPDCRVAVSTYTPNRPFVIEKYKHPFLLAFKKGQEICMKDFVPSNNLTAQNFIRTLEEGLTAMLYGYDSRRRNGYHSLDKTWVHIPTIDFEDYRI